MLSKNQHINFVQKVYLSCKTDEQRSNCESWFYKIADEWPDEERKYFIQWLYDIKNPKHKAYQE